MRQTLSIARKELGAYFGSPMALIFVGVFLAVTLFSFFWVDTFFARGVADVRPLFRWMPILLIFLVSALTMRQWSEEQRSGTMEILLTLPVPYLRLVLGKFLAVLALVAVALALTLSLPVTVSILGNLDWGPVVGGYLAAILLAGAYAAIGLFVSSRTDNQIVTLIVSALIGGTFYVVGSGGLNEFVPDAVGEILQALGTGTRFESIERGVVDLRDLLYYLTLTALFLTLNIVSLDNKRWSRGPRTRSYRRSVTWMTALIAANLVVMNVWIYPLRGLRLDLTQDREFSLSAATDEILGSLQEPLLVRGYFSERTHPLLAPLVPRIRDLLHEYEIAADGRLELEFIDPSQNPELEAEANQVYGIRPTPFQISGRYEASVINSYFNLLFRYGDQSVVLDFQDLIEVEQIPNDTLDVRLRNLEYDLTRSIKKVVSGFQSVESVLGAMEDSVRLTLYVSPETLPERLAGVPGTVENVVGQIAADSGGALSMETVNPYAVDSPISPQALYETYGIQPVAVSLFSDQGYYLAMVLEVGDQAQVLYPSGEVSEAEIRTSIESALKRAAPGFLRVVGLWVPPATPTQDVFGQMQQPISSWNLVAEQLRRDYEVRSIDLTSGEVPAGVDVLVLLAPQNLTELGRFAVDQYLMRGGAVVAAAGNFVVSADPVSGGIQLRPIEGGIQPLLEHYGILVEPSLVLDPQNEPFPVPVERQVGGFTVQEIQLIDYPHFVDVRPDGMNRESPITANLPAVTLNWVSPLSIDQTGQEGKEWSILLQSSPASWVSSSTNIQPNFDLYPQLGFPVEQETRRQTLAVAVSGVFQSFFEDNPSPFDRESGQDTGQPTPPAPAAGTIEVSPESARLVVFGSGEFLDDLVFGIASNLSGERYLNSLQLLQNAVDWSVEDLDLLSIRARGTKVRVLEPIERSAQRLWEAGNYAVALAALVGIGLVWNLQRRRQRPMDLPQRSGDGRESEPALQEGGKEER